MRRNPKNPSGTLSQGEGHYPARMRSVLLIFATPADAEAWDAAGQPFALPGPPGEWLDVDVEVHG